MNKKYLILSLDGGGVRCALQIILLKRICEKFPQLESRIRLIAGTSAGALVGAAVGALGVAKMIEHMLSQSFAKKIFTESWTHEVRSMRGLYRSNYTNKELEKLLITVFGSSTLLNHYCAESATAPNLLITSFCIDTTAESLACSKCKIPLKPPAKPSSAMEVEMKDMSATTTTTTTTTATTTTTIVEPTREVTATTIEQVKNVEADGNEIMKPTDTESMKKDSVTKWSAFVSSLPTFMRWNGTTNSVNSGSVVAADVQTRNEIIQEACNQQKQHQNPQHKCNCAAWHAQLYHTFNGMGGNVSFVDVLLRSTAAPTYFPSHNSCVDGGVIAQNPSLLAITHALKYARNDDNTAMKLEDIVLLSLGTGSHPMNMNTYGAKADLGLAQWVPNLTYLFNDASLDATDINCRNLLGNQYLRVQLRMPRAVDLANFNEWAELVLWAEQEPLEKLFDQIASLIF